MAKGNYTSKIASNVQSFSIDKPKEELKDEIIQESIPIMEKSIPVKDFVSTLRKKRKKTNHSFYLEDDVYDQLLIFCNSIDVTPSSYINELIKNDLLNRQ